MLRRLFDADLRTFVRVAVKRWLLDMFENYGAALSCVDSVVAADISAWTSNFGAASLAN